MSAKSRTQGLLRRLWIFTPFLIFPILLYMIVAMFSGSTEGALAYELFDISMLSGGRWHFHLGDLILSFGLICLFAEILKSTSTRSTAIVNHGLSMGLLVIGLILFLSLKSFATSVYFLLILMGLLDVVAGFMVSIVSARRDFGVGGGLVE